MKKITFFVGSMEEGGAERVISNLTAYLSDCGYSVLLVLYHDREIFYRLDERVEVKVVCRETDSTNPWKNMLWLRRFFKKNSSVVISFLAVFNILATVSTMGSPVPVLVADRNDPRYVPTNPVMRAVRNLMYRFADGVVIQTQHNKRYFSKAVQKKSIIIYNPIDLGERRAEATRTAKDDLIVSVGRLMPQKNQAMLIRAFFEICEEFPTYKLVFYGEGNTRADLEALIDSLGLHGRVMLPGSEKNIFDKIVPAKIFVLPSDYEGMPNALAEAMCLGLPCISTAVSGATDMIKTDKNGILVGVGAQDELKNALLKVLKDEAYAENLGKNAAQLNDLLDKSVIAEQWRQYILQFCK